MKNKIMRSVCLLVLVFFSLGSAGYASNAELDNRIWEAKQVMSEIMATPDKSIPEELLAKCKAIAIYPSVLKGGFIIGARFGKGIVLRRNEATGKWGPVAFSTIGGGSWGLQIGAEATDLILVVLNERGLDGLIANKFMLGADASIAAGPVGRSSEASTDISLKAGIISYSRSRGLFGGMALDGAVCTTDNFSNSQYYGKPVSSQDVLFGSVVEVQPSSRELTEALNEYSSRWGKRIRK